MGVLVIVESVITYTSLPKDFGYKFINFLTK